MKSSTLPPIDKTSPKVWFLLAALACLILLERLHTFAEPWYNDMAFFAVIGNELLHGRLLYSDLWDIKPPGIYTTYALADAIFGHSDYLLIWLGFLTGTATMIGLFFCGKSLSGRVEGGLWAAGFWALLATDLHLEESQVNCEAFMNVFLTGAFVLLVWRWKKGAPPWWAYACLGSFWALVAMYKQFMALEALVVGTVYCLAAPAGKERTRAILGIGLAWGVGLMAGLGTAAYFYFTDRGKILWETLYTYGQFYSGGLLNNVWLALGPQFLFPGWFWFVIPLGLLSLMAVGLAWRRQPWMAQVFLAYLAIKFVEKALPGKLYRHHYYQLIVPALCLGAAWGITLLAEKYSRKAGWIAGGLLVLALGVYEGHLFLLTPEEWSRVNYGLDYVGVNQVAQEVNMVLKPGEEFYEWAEYPRFYYVCNRRPPVGVLYGAHLFNSDPLSGGPLAGEFDRRTIGDLEKNQPQLVIWDKEWKPEGWSENPVALYLLAHYRPFAACGLMGRFEFQCRIGGDLDQRLKAGVVFPVGVR